MKLVKLVKGKIANFAFPNFSMLFPQNVTYSSGVFFDKESVSFLHFYSSTLNKRGSGTESLIKKFFHWLYYFHPETRKEKKKKKNFNLERLNESLKI